MELLCLSLSEISSFSKLERGESKVIFLASHSVLPEGRNLQAVAGDEHIGG